MDQSTQRLCRCNLPATRYISGAPTSAGEAYWKCHNGHAPGSCRYFDWERQPPPPLTPPSSQSQTRTIQIPVQRLGQSCQAPQMDSAFHPPRPTTSAFATQVTPMRPGPYNPRTPALTAEQARMMVQEEFGSDSHQSSPITARLGSPHIQLPGQGTARTSPTFHTALEDIDLADEESPSKRRRLDSKGKAREFPYEFDHGTHFFSSSTRTSNMPLLNPMHRSATEPQVGDGAARLQQGSYLLTENEILRQLLAEKEKENACLRRQIKLLKKLSKATTSDTHMSETRPCGSPSSVATTVELYLQQDSISLTSDAEE